MNELITINYDREIPTVSGRCLHAGLRVKEKYTEWFKRMCEYGFSDDKDFVLVSEISETNNPKNPTTTITDHAVTIAMAKELCMLQRVSSSANTSSSARNRGTLPKRSWSGP